MPRRSSSGTSPDWDSLFEIASAQAGYVTNAQAATAGYSLPLLQFHVRKGRLERALRGVLRLVHYPPGEHEDLVPIWLWSDQLGVFSHETALLLHDLSDALPAQRSLTVPASWAARRLRAPPGVLLRYADVPDSERTWLGPVPLTTPLRTVADCVRDHVDSDLVRQAVTQGIGRRLFTRNKVNAALKAAEGERDASAKLREP